MITPCLTATQIRRLRKDLSKTQHEFARLCHVRSWVTVSRWERGATKPHAGAAQRLNEMWLANENRKGADHELDLEGDAIRKLELIL